MTNAESTPILLGSLAGQGPLSSSSDPLDATMDRYAEGDDSAFSELARCLRPRLRAFLQRLAGSPDLAEDLTQETFLRMHRGRGSFARGGAVIPWAYAIARNCFVSHTRAKKTRFPQNSLDVTEIEVATGPEANAEASVAAQQSAKIVAQVLRDMPVANRAFRAYEMLRAALGAADSKCGPS
jgi:RNA polymerase sigma-70 factor (ECF subfamily)